MADFPRARRVHSPEPTSLNGHRTPPDDVGAASATVTAAEKAVAYSRRQSERLVAFALLATLAAIAFGVWRLGSTVEQLSGIIQSK